MKHRFVDTIRLFPLVLPFVFILLFFGYAPPKYSVTLYTDNIQGEGVGYACLCSAQEFAYEYQAGFYFGSQLKTVEIPRIHYDVRSLQLDLADVQSAEFYGFDVKAFGFKLGYYDMRDQIAPGHYGTEDGGVDVSLSEDGERLRLEFLNPDTTTTITLTNDVLSDTFWLLYWLFVALVTCIAAFCMTFLWDKIPAAHTGLIGASGIAAAMILGCLICGSLPYVDYLDFILNYLIVCSVSFLLNALTLPFIGTAIAMGFVLFWYVANYFVIAFRSKPIMPADLKAIGTLREVISGYTLTLNPEMLLGLAVVLAFGAAAVVSWRHNRDRNADRKKQWMRRGVGIAVSMSLFLLCTSNLVLSQLNSFQWDNRLLKCFHSEGMVLTFLKAQASSKVKKPEGYSKEAVQAYLKEYQSQPAQAGQGIRPTNIIMVMDEAFSDLRVDGLDQGIDVMPWIDSLEANTIEGSLSVSVFGGGTCNTEFEALTGNTMAFLNAGAYPYTENVERPLFSLASFLKNLGYETQAFHANEAKNWNRNRVYPNLGFQRFNSIEDYPTLTDELTLHEHPADVADFQYLESVRQGLKGKPAFLFDVTMQNHSPYDRWEDVPKAEGVEELYFDTQVYLSLVKASDQAIQQLMHSYEKLKEPTMVIYFGDHQPGLSAYAYSEFSSGTVRLDRYKSKFFIWTNYETESRHDITISANYLPWLILERGHFELPPYVRMLGEVYRKYPVISAQGVVDADGNVYESVSDVLEDSLIRKYQYIQYANLFDELEDDWFHIS